MPTANAAIHAEPFIPIAETELAALGARLDPPVVAIEVNDVCASQCGHCSYGHLRAEGGLIDLDRLLAAVREARRYGCRVLTVAAREPFLPSVVKRTLAVLSQALEVGYPSVGAITSARFLPAAYEALSRAGLKLNSLDVSVDGLGATHDRLRGVDEWKWIAQELERERYRDVARYLCASVTLQRENADELIALLDWLAVGPRVDGALIATAAMNGRNDAACGLYKGQFTQFLERLEAWYRERRPAEMEVVIELTPNSVPEICELCESGVLRAEEVGISEYGLPLLQRPGGLPVRVIAGVFSFGRVLRIDAGGRARLYYDQPNARLPGVSWDLRGHGLSDMLESEHRSGRVFLPVVEAARRRPQALRSSARD